VVNVVREPPFSSVKVRLQTCRQIARRSRTLRVGARWRGAPGACVRRKVQYALKWRYVERRHANAIMPRKPRASEDTRGAENGRNQPAMRTT